MTCALKLATATIEKLSRFKGYRVRWSIDYAPNCVMPFTPGMLLSRERAHRRRRELRTTGVTTIRVMCVYRKKKP